MDKIEFFELIDKGEDYYTEFKKQAVHPEGLAAEIVGFANSDGGRLLIGVSEDRVPVGGTDDDKEIRRIDNICTNNCEPLLFCKIEKIKVNDKLVLLIKIPKGSERPYEIPLEVFREGIVNAVVHRDYHIKSQIRVLFLTIGLKL